MGEKNLEINSEKQIFLNNEKFDVPAEGMLGLLALGDVGLKLWRKKRAEAMKQEEEEKFGNSTESITSNNKPTSSND